MIRRAWQVESTQCVFCLSFATTVWATAACGEALGYEPKRFRRWIGVCHAHRERLQIALELEPRVPAV